MLQKFQNKLLDTNHFVVTLELVPGRESFGRSVDTVMAIARDAFADGRVSAVSITDNPGGNPSLSPDALGHDIFHIGMDVIVHFTCRDMNRVGMESRALQLAMLGMKNILALTGDYAGQGFGGQGAPVFDLDSVQLQILLEMLSERMNGSGDPGGFFAGCAVSPFKQTEGECFAQYAKLCRKVAAGAQFIITQLGYDARKFQELQLMLRHTGLNVPTLGSVYVLTPGSAEILNSGQVPGAVVTGPLLKQIQDEWRDKKAGRRSAIERAARLAAVIKGLGYRGIHIGGIHQGFETAGKILDRLEVIQDHWLEFIDDFSFSHPGTYYVFESGADASVPSPRFGQSPVPLSVMERFRYGLLAQIHRVFFDHRGLLAPFYRNICQRLDNNMGSRLLVDLLEHPSKKLLLNCAMCGDCAIEHLGFLCPESQCPKHIRNGACGGSHNGHCEVHSDRPCVWHRAYARLRRRGHTDQMVKGCIPPRMWELDQSSSWLNFHLGRDHQSASHEIARRCRTGSCQNTI